MCGLLRAHGRGRLRLVDTRAEGLLPLLRSRHGISTWHVDTETFLCGEAKEDLAESIEKLPAVQPSMLPPSEEKRAGCTWKGAIECCRMTWTGGFFVAVLELSIDGVHSVSKGDEDRTRKAEPVKERKVHIDSTPIMKQLGYNPRSRRKEGHQEKKRARVEALKIALTPCTVHSNGLTSLKGTKE